MENEFVYWQIEDEHFAFPQYLKDVKSKKGNEIRDLLDKIDNGIKIFLRGSLLEHEKPFEKSDIDLIVLYKDNYQLHKLKKNLQYGDNYDIKLIKDDNNQGSYVLNALLQCRSLQISGLKYHREKIKADKQFAWEHWVQYCPAAIPNIINTKDHFSLIHFKLLTRCFGVLSYLRYRKFTRDISECINIAKMEYSDGADILSKLRCCLENRQSETFNVNKTKLTLIKKFDEYFNCW